MVSFLCFGDINSFWVLLVVPLSEFQTGQPKRLERNWDFLTHIYCCIFYEGVLGGF